MPAHNIAILIVNILAEVDYFQRRRNYFFISQISETWQPRPLSPRSGSRYQLRFNSPPRVAAGGMSNSTGPYGHFLADHRMNFDGFVGHAADFFSRRVAAVHDAHLVLGRWVEPVIVHPQGRLEQRLGMVLPTVAHRTETGEASRATRPETPDPSRSPGPRPGAAASRSCPDRRRIRRAPDWSSSTISSMPRSRSDSTERLRSTANRSFSHKRLFSGTSTVSSVAPRSTPIALYLGTLVCILMLVNNSSASSNTRLRQSAATGRRRCPEFFRRRPCAASGAGLGGFAEPIHGLIFEIGFMNQPGPHIGVVVGPIQGLLKSPVGQHSGEAVFSIA